ncbi:hypothetical protein IC620_15595 [Hazenella sp. IB182357]|uniref:Replication protein n=1 Tax=Polycladospora coralii TaxID=2771432 RepID=A0A926RVM8_9BACL|nr:hypothetical protein [Polycladospora coralii]MBD1373769.1 hypothetical protein [Polycladospora coralii]
MDQENIYIEGGYIILARKIIESEIMKKPPLYMKVWIYLLASAQHSDYKSLKRGQLKTKIPEIQEACSWYVGARKETPTKREIQRILDWMKKESRNAVEQSTEVTSNSTMIVTTKVTHGMIINIENYNVYQRPSNYERYDERTHERYDEGNMNGSEGFQYKQECNKNEQEIKNDDDSLWSQNPPLQPEDPNLKEIKNLFSRKAAKLHFSMDEEKEMIQLLEDNIPVETILEGIEIAFKRFKPQHSRSKISSFKYCIGPILEAHHAKTQPRERKTYEHHATSQTSKFQSSNNQRTNTEYPEIGSGYYNQFDGLFGN